MQYFVQNPDILRCRVIFVEKIGKVTGGGIFANYCLKVIFMKSVFYSLFITLLVSMISCKKEDPVDLSLINCEVEMTCVDDDYESNGRVTHTILCSGYVGGINGPVYVQVKEGGSGLLSEKLTVSGMATSFSFTFEDRDDKPTDPKTYHVMMYYEYGMQMIFESHVVVMPH